MKRHVRPTSQKWPIAIFGILCATAFSACSRNTQEAELQPDGSTQLTFEVVGITDETSAGEISPEESIASSNGNDFIQRNSRQENNEAKPEFVSTKKMVTDDDFDAIVTFEEEGYGFSTKGDSAGGSKLQPVNSPGKSGSSGANVAAAMPAGNKYRILIYDNNNAYVGTIDATSGTAFTPGFPVFQNTTYTWYAYSYNSTTTPAVPTNTASPTLTPAAGISALLYDSGTLTTVAGSNKIDITFEHKLASIAIRLDARGMFATINSVTASNTTAGSLSTGVLNLRTGAYNSVTANSSPTQLSAWTNVAAATGDTIKVAYFYTANTTTALTNFGVTLNNFVVNLDDGTTRTFTSKPFTFTTSFTPQLGRRYTGTITLIESAVTIAGVQWARSNLYYRASDQGYRFRHKNSNTYGQTTDPAASNEYFNFGARTGATASATLVLNQCRQVYPYNTWRLPQIADANALVAATTPTKTYARSTDAYYVAWNLGGTNEYGNNWLALLAIGRRSAGTNVLTDYSFILSSSGFYWTNSYTGTTSATYIRANVVAAGGVASGGTVVTETGVQNQGLNIRCVRNVNPTT